MSTPTIFLSAVTTDFGLPFLDRLRIAIHDELGCVCRYRGNLKQGSSILPEKLRGEIESADCVIHLVGPRFGFGPNDVQQSDLERTPAGEYWKAACKSWWPLSNFPARRSYTQMEFDFAVQLKRPVYVIFVDAPPLIAAASAQPSDEAELQAAHRRAIEVHGHEYVTADSLVTLEAIAEKLPVIVEHLKKQIVALRDVIGSVDQRLAHIESAVIAPPKPAPPFQLPSAASKYFGRGALVDDLAARLRTRKRTDVWGGPGMGKTALAAEAVARIVGDDPASLSSSPFPHGVVFLDLYLHKGSLDTAWNALANAFDDSLPTDMSAAERASKACAHRQALIILEGAEELGATLTDFIAVVAPESALLVLTREEAQTSAGRRIRLDDLLHADDALALLRHLAGAVPETILSAVQARLGGHPLALTWAGSQLGDATQPPANFLRDLESEPFTTLTEPGGKPEHTLKWMFDRSVHLMGDSTRTVLAAAARISELFDADLAEVAGGQEADLRRLVQLSFLRVGAEAWQFAHVLAAQYARELPLPEGLLQKLGGWAIAAIATADARCHIEGTAHLGLALAHATALLAHDGVERVLGSVASALIYHHADETVGIRRGQLDFARRAVEAVRQWQEQAPAEEKATPTWQRESSVSLNRLGDLAVAQGDLAGALRYFTEDMAIAERLAGPDPANAAWQHDLCASWSRMGDIAVSQGDLVAASDAYTKSKDILERLAASDPVNATWQHDLSVSLDKLGDLAVAQGDLAGAFCTFTQSQTIRERLAASDPANAAWQRALSVSLEKLGDLAVAPGDLAGAFCTFTQSQTIRERLAASDPANAAWQMDYAVSLNRLGSLARQQDNVPEMLRCYDEALAIVRRLAASDPANASWQTDYAGLLFNAAMAARQAGRTDGVMERLNEAWGIVRTLETAGRLTPTGSGRQLFDQLKKMTVG